MQVQCHTGEQTQFEIACNRDHHKDNIFRILWFSDWLHNTTSAGNSIFVTNHNTISCGSINTGVEKAQGVLVVEQRDCSFGKGEVFY